MSIVNGKAEVIIGKQRHGPIGTVGCSSTAASPASRIWRTTSTCRSVESSAGVGKVKLSDQHGPATARARRAVPLSARAVLTVDLTALRANWARLNQASGRAECAGVIKADAYGLGLGPDRQGAHQRRLQDLLRRHARRRPRRARGAARRHRLRARRPAARRRAALCRLRPAPGARRASTRCATGPPTAARADAGCRRRMHIDTGINRLGMPESSSTSWPPSRALLAAFDITLVMSHLACADVPDSPSTPCSASASRSCAPSCRRRRPASPIPAA